MKSLKTLIKLNRRNLDVKRRALVNIEEQITMLEYTKENLQKELVTQQEFVAENSEFLFSYNSYYLQNRENQGYIAHEITKLQNMAAKISQEIYELFTEVKKYEIILSNKEKQIVIAQNKKEEEALDEVAINIFLRDNSKE
jgi:hypothetical protein